MANQIVVSAGAKVRNLGGVLTATSGVVSSLPINASNGIPQLDVNGKILVSQLPNSVMEYLGVWNAATNTPTLANGTGNQGDVYLCNVAGTVDFGAGPIVFFVGDQVIYSGSIWQRASGATGTVTSVAVTESGDSLNITGSPITTSGTINIGFNGTNLQYVNGAGNLTTFPDLTGFVPYTGATSNVNLGVYDLTSRLIKIDGSTNGGSLNIKQNATTIVSGIGYNSISAKSDTSLQLYYGNATTSTFKAVLLNVNNIIDGSTRAFEFPDANGTIALTSDIPSLTGYVPYTGATANVDLGVYDLTADLITGARGSFASNGGSDTFAINHSSGGGIALNITKGGAGEGLYINKTSGSGNAATIVGTLEATTLVKTSGTSSQFLKADGSVDSSSYITLASLSASSPLSYNSGTGAFSISQASGSTNGYLSSTDWTTFNNKQNALTNPVTGTGTTNYLPKFTGTSTIGNSLIQDDGTYVSIGYTTNPSLYKLDVNGTGRFSGALTAATLSTIGTAIAGQNVQLNLNGVSGKAQRIEFQNSGVQQWLLGAGAASETSAFELYNATGTIVLSVDKSTNVSTFRSSVIATSTAAYSGDALRLQTKNDSASYYMNVYPTDAGASGINWTFRQSSGGGGSWDVMTFSQGRVGIGTTSPLYATLQVVKGGAGQGDANGAIMARASDGDQNWVSIGNFSTAGSSYGWIQASSLAAYKNLALNPTGGNVIIGGTTAGTSLNTSLTVNNSSAGNYSGLIAMTANVQRGYYGGTSTGLEIGVAGSGLLDIYTNGSPRMRITSGGKVLIGTATSGGSILRISGIQNGATGLSVGDVYEVDGFLCIKT